MKQHKSKSLSKQIDLGLAISGATLPPGQCRGYKAMAAYCDCSHQAIKVISDGAILKIRQALRKQGIISTETKTQ